jgi:hypothetical protein
MKRGALDQDQDREWIATANRWLSKWAYWLEWLSGEFILTKVRRANGGDVILARALFVVVWMCIPLFVLGLCFPSAGPDMTKLGAILAVVYAALYARFSQQWQYLANLYNTIKTAEVRTATQEQKRGLQVRLAQWKAGFIEDAHTLHLANKPMIASIICAWADDPKVAFWFNEYTSGGAARFEEIVNEARETCEREDAKWAAKANKAA